jgi:WD40 repeat protein
MDLDWTSDSKYLISASLDKDAIIWDLANKKELKVQAHFQGLKCVKLMDDNTFITASEDFCLKSWTFDYNKKE